MDGEGRDHIISIELREVFTDEIDGKVDPFSLYLSLFHT